MVKEEQGTYTIKINNESTNWKEFEIFNQISENKNITLEHESEMLNYYTLSFKIENNYI
jgi:hypothetical protein